MPQTRTMRCRPLTSDDADLLRRATLENVNWSGPRFTAEDVDSDPRLSHYTTFDPVRGDFGLVAEEEGSPIGVCWCLFLPEDEPGFGFVDTAIPELSVWVAAESRGQGLGRMLIAATQEEARERRIECISLSVEEGNQARMLYWSLGFHDVAGREADGVMSWHDKI